MSAFLTSAHHEKIASTLKARNRRQTCLKLMGLVSILFSLGFMLILIGSIALNGVSALTQHHIQLTIPVEAADFLDADGEVSQQVAFNTNWDGKVRKALRGYFPDVSEAMERRALNGLISVNAGYDLKDYLFANPALADSVVTVWLKTSDEVDQYFKGRISRRVAEDDRTLSNQQLDWADRLRALGVLESHFNTTFFTAADSREPESAGILGAVVGSAMALVVTLVLALPLSIMAAIYLEYFAKPGRLTDFIEVNINNLAAVPSIVFGLLGLAIFLNFFGMPRSAPLVGGAVLSLMTIPTIIIAARASIRAVPSSIRDAALGLGASPMQAAIDHVLPMAMPGILTGTIIGMAQALGESAPLLMIGMVAFIVDVPGYITDPATVLPVQIFVWSDSAERAFYERSSLAILVLLLFLIVMNLSAVLLRRRFEKNH